MEHQHEAELERSHAWRHTNRARSIQEHKVGLETDPGSIRLKACPRNNRPVLDPIRSSAWFPRQTVVGLKIDFQATHVRSFELTILFM